MESSSYNKAIETYKKTLTTAASLAASAMLARTVINEVVPHEIQDFISTGIFCLRARLSARHTIVIAENEGFAANQIYEASKMYLATRINASISMRRLRVSQLDAGKGMVLALEPGEEMIDVFEGIEFEWQLVCREPESSSGGSFRHGSSNTEVRSFELSLHKKHKDKAMNSYLPFILARWKAIEEEDRTLQLFMNEGDSWCPIDLHHPATFEALAMDADLKRAVMEDLARFVERKDYYKRIGRAWKRGYLLYGPPGTGKSSLIAAMANYLKFDIYDLELTEVNWNSALRRLLVGMSNRSILVIEDIDCSIELQQREEETSAGPDKITLSGLLNFVDGLWSTSGEQRIIVFTTNYKERLDPALLRPGRMDMHIHMSYCTPYAFRVLVSNYHAIHHHPLFEEIEGLIKEVDATPAEIAEELMRSDAADIALRGLLEFLQGKRRKEASENMAKAESLEDEKGGRKGRSKMMTKDQI